MPALTLTILASVLRLHGSDATVSNDHKCINLLLGEVREQLGEQRSPSLLHPEAKREIFAEGQKADDDLKNVRDHKQAIIDTIKDTKVQAKKPTTTKPNTSGSAQMKGKR